MDEGRWGGFGAAEMRLEGRVRGPWSGYLGELCYGRAAQDADACVIDGNGKRRVQSEIALRVRVRVSITGRHREVGFSELN
jgi:hypothetical protein